MVPRDSLIEAGDLMEGFADSEECVGTTVVWSVRLEGLLERVPDWMSVLSEDDVEAARGFLSVSRSREFLGSRLFRRLQLGSWLGVSPRELQFSRSEFGRPVLLNCPRRLNFSLSHSGGICVLAVDEGAPVGVDIEERRNLDLTPELLEVAFSSSEVKSLDDCPPEQRLRRFYDLWVRKEAVLKGLGVGLLSAPSSLNLVRSARLTEVFEVAGEQLLLSEWRVQELSMLPSEFSGCLARRLEK